MLMKTAGLPLQSSKQREKDLRGGECWLKSRGVVVLG